jgi:hypothetical protein
VLIEEVFLARKMGVSFDEVPYVLTARPELGSSSKFVYSWEYVQTIRAIPFSTLTRAKLPVCHVSPSFAKVERHDTQADTEETG